MLTDHLPHGDGLAAFGFIRELGARGFDLQVAAGGLELQQALPPNVHLHRLGPAGAGLRRARLATIRRTAGLYRRLARAAPFDLVHQLNPVDVGVSLALPGRRVPVVLGPYVPDWARSGVGADVDAAQGAAARAAKRVLRSAQQRRADTVLLSSPAAAAKVEPGVEPGTRVELLTYGIDADAWRPPAAEPSGQTVLFLANLELRKGIHVLLDAFARVAGDHPDARLAVAGIGPEDDAVRRRVAASPELARVDLLGPVERERALAAMQSCAVYCLPSYGEPFGITALEAMACARPVVATATGGLRHLVPDAGGRKVPEGDAAALASALSELLADPALRRSMGEHNRRVVEQRYSWGRVVDRLEQIYREAMLRRRR